MANILIIDDDEILCEALGEMIRRMGHESDRAHLLEEGLALAQSTPFDIVLLDVRMPDGNGLQALPEIRGTPSEPEVIIITGAGSVGGADLAIRSGAWDYIEKASSLKEMSLPITRALQYRKEKSGATSRVALKRDGIVGVSPALNASLDLLAQAAGTDANVLLTGETGTGKEVFASAMHENSARASKEFVVVDCTALPETLVESVLFGHERGAFTGAHQASRGLVKQADGGTLFLDEIGELPLSLQKSFLRVLQEKRFRPVGSDHEMKSDFRLVAASNRDLERMAREKRFREDLLYRLRACAIELPPLRQRREDVKEIAFHHANRLCELYGVQIKGFAPDFLEALCAYDWPGNVRELVNTIERVLSAAREEPTFFARHLPHEIRIHSARSRLKTPKDGSADAGAEEVQTLTEDAARTEEKTPAPLPTLREFREGILAKAERDYLRNLMAQSAGDIEEACRISGVKRARLYGLLKEHGTSRQNR